MDAIFRPLLSLPAGDAAREKMERVKRLGAQRFIAEDDGELMLGLLDQLSFEYHYGGGLYLLAELYRTGEFSPGIDEDQEKAIAYTVLALAHPSIPKVVLEATLQEMGAYLLGNYETLQAKYRKEIEVLLERKHLSKEVLKFLKYALEKEKGADDSVDLLPDEVVAENVAGNGKGSTAAAFVHPAWADNAEETEGSSKPTEPEAGHDSTPVDEEKARQEKAAAEEKRRKAENAKAERVAKKTEADLLKQEANDLYSIGSVPGNAGGRKMLLDAAGMYEKAAAVYPHDYVYLSNASQAYVAAEEWSKAKERAEEALEVLSKEEMETIARGGSAGGDSAAGAGAAKFGPPKRKLLARLGLAQIRLREFHPAADTLNIALRLSKKDPHVLDEIWRICEQIPLPELPEDHEWAVTSGRLERLKPDYVAMEKRICGKWEYHSVVQGTTTSSGENNVDPASKRTVKANQFEIKFDLMNPGRLLYCEEEVVVELMQDYLCQWHGDFTLIPGMVLKLDFDPARDALTVMFVPPSEEEMTPDFREKFGHAGIQKFTTTRRLSSLVVAEEDEGSREEEVVAGRKSGGAVGTSGSEAAGTSSKKGAGEALSAGSTRAAASAVSGTPSAASSPAAAPKKQVAATKRFFLQHCDTVPDLVGEYELGESNPDHEEHFPVYKQKTTSTSTSSTFYAWCRSSQWVFTESVEMSSFRAPALLRCANARGGSPADLRPRPCWFSKGKKAPEIMDKSVVISKEVPDDVGARGAATATSTGEGDAAAPATGPSTATTSSNLPAAGVVAELRPDVLYVDADDDALRGFYVFREHGDESKKEEMNFDNTQTTTIRLAVTTPLASTTSRAERTGASSSSSDSEICSEENVEVDANGKAASFFSTAATISETDTGEVLARWVAATGTSSSGSSASGSSTSSGSEECHLPWSNVADGGSWEREKQKESRTKYTWTQSRTFERDRRMHCLSCPAFLKGGLVGTERLELWGRAGDEEKEAGRFKKLSECEVEVNPASIRVDDWQIANPFKTAELSVKYSKKTNKLTLAA